ncbi:MAG: GGDEF domain-containing protein [Aquabacterium sp.]|uniref:GGDEF domain-containing protein n=1 Tax=Aquabacterium sp. TaxID=1872578 RepID=UPI001218651D|nr:GGDEF domain-containing protein [Aquabacterium sp.]TAK89796.1 MAG: GGDEF domain-containing protein [Aquabacterium sp.]
MLIQHEPLVIDFNVRHLLAWRPSSLRMDDIDEAHFNAACGLARVQHFVISGFLALLVYNLFLLVDVRMIPDVYPQALHMRLYMFSPVALIMLLCGMAFKQYIARMPRYVLEGVLMMTGVVAALHMGWLLQHSNSPYAGMYTAGLVPITIYGNLVQRFRFRYALVFSLVVMGTCLACVWARSDRVNLYDVFDVPLALLVAVIAIYTLAMNYRFELEERRRFQWQVRAQALHKQLEASQVQLDELSRQDSLTGVPNRRHVDAYLRQHWDQAQQAGDELALLLMDVDHFKAFNDRYGHPAGDQCLKHVARALQQHVPPQVGCVARWGGEEFIVVLPRAQLHVAMRRAQALCHVVHGLGLRHDAAPTLGCVTISVGVAVVRPSSGASIDSIDSLIAQADAALYRAKAGGRNRAEAPLSPVSG